MKRIAVTAFVAWLLLLALGCASGRAQLRNAVDAYTTTLNVLAEYRRAGLIDDEQAAEIERWRVAARHALDAWRVAVQEGESEDAPVRAFNEAMRALTDAALEAERRHGSEDQ